MRTIRPRAVSCELLLAIALVAATVCVADADVPVVPVVPIPPPPADGTTHPPHDGSAAATGSDAGTPTGDLPPPPDGSGAGSGSGTGSAAADLPSREPTAADSAGAPLPGQESGRVDPPPGDSALRVVARGILFLPKTVYQVLFLPVVAAFYALDRFHIDQLYYKIFFNANHTIGIVPTATYEAGIGAAVGVRFQMADVFGAGERLAVQATTGAILGDPYREAAQLELHSGHRLGDHFELSLLADVDRRPEDAFYGIGNGDLQPGPPATPVDVQTSDFAFLTHNRYREERVAVTGDLHPTDELHVNATGALTDLAFAPSVGYGTPLDQVYVPADIPGFAGGVRHVYGELELRYDGRHRATLWEPPKMYSGGSLVSVYAGRVDRIDGGTDFWRYGGELQHYFRLGRGPRTLITRLRAAGVTGDLADVPFDELPELGGADFLRGYAYNRFRDRASLLATLQYSWDLSYFMDAYVFADLGRVYHSFEDLTLHDQRLGYGVGLDFHGQGGLLMTASIGSSSDGGLVFLLAFNPAVDARTRWR